LFFILEKIKKLHKKVLTSHNTCIILEVTRAKEVKKMKKIKVDEFEKKGKTIEVFVEIIGIDRYRILLKGNDKEVPAEIGKSRGIDGYRIYKDAVKKLFNTSIRESYALLSNKNAPKIKE